MRKIGIMIGLAALATSCGSQMNTTWTNEEKALIEAPESQMRVLTIESQEDLNMLRSKCSDLTWEDIASDTYRLLEQKMIATVTSPEQDGVGIAGPQVGIGRRIVAVQRFDKEGEPFEVYPNIRITAHRGEMEPGAEGCLSVPGERGTVMRWQDIDVQYTSVKTGLDSTEHVKGFTAVIFQHETDHLDGILYIDKREPVSND